MIMYKDWEVTADGAAHPPTASRLPRTRTLSISCGRPPPKTLLLASRGRRQASAAGSITVQVLGFLTLIVGIYILTVTRESPPGCANGLRAVLGRAPDKAQYQLCDVEEKDPV